MNRFGSEIEADLRIHCGGADVLDVFRDKMSIRTALNLIDRCPQAAHWREAYLQDDELVRLALEETDEDSDGEPSIAGTDYTPTVALLTLACDLLGHLLATVNAALSQDGTVKPPAPLPRPIRAAQRVRQDIEDEAFEDLVARIEQAQSTGGDAAPDSGMTFDLH